MFFIDFAFFLAFVLCIILGLMHERYTFLYSPSRLIIKYNTSRLYLFGAAFLIVIVFFIILDLCVEPSSQFTEVQIFEKVYHVYIPVRGFLILAAIVTVFFLAFIYLTLYSPIYLVADIDKGLVYYERKHVIHVDDILFIKLNDYVDSRGYIHSYLSLVISQLQNAKSIHISWWGVDYLHIKAAKSLSVFLNKEIKDLRQFNTWETDL